MSMVEMMLDGAASASASVPVISRPWMRPSVLPKISLCGHYRPEEFAGEAAGRGTVLDEAFRASIPADDNEGDSEAESEESPDDGGSSRALALRAVMAGADGVALAAEDSGAVLWAVDTARALAGPCSLEAREDRLRVDCGVAPLPPGTADLLCVAARWSADLKSGLERDYESQQACYALGFMDLYFCDEWVVYLLYCDLRKVVRLTFTREGAEEIIRDALGLYLGGVPPEPNAYCGWCSQRWQCPARREALGLVLPPEETMAADLGAMDSIKLRNFVLAGKTLEDFIKEARRILAKRRLREEIPGVTLVNKRGSSKLPAVELAGIAQKHPGEVLALLGSISEEKALAIWSDHSNEPFPAAAVVHSPGCSFVKVTMPKPPKEKKLKD